MTLTKDVCNLYYSPLDVQLKLRDDADDCAPHAHPGPNCAFYRTFSFDVRAASSNYPQKLALVDPSYYPAGARISARAINAPATLRLDSFFEGTYVSRTSRRARGAGLSGEVNIFFPKGKERKRVSAEGFANRHMITGAVGWENEEAAIEGASYAEVEVDEGILHSPTVDIRPWSFRRNGS